MAYELGDVDGACYLAMEFIRGPTLLDLLRRAQRAKRQLSVQSTLTIARCVAAALEHVHQLRDVDGEPLHVIHRDVTPQNTLIGYDGTVKLIDFGIVQARVQTHETAAGVVKGKFSYLAPEQIDPHSPVDHRTDLFSLGIMLHEALLGCVLFRGRTDRETIKRVLHAPIPSPSDERKEVPKSLSEVVLRALQRDPAQRYPTATALLADLEDVAQREGLGASLIHLRDEVRELCGSAQEYRIPTVATVDVEPELEDEAPTRPAERSGRRRHAKSSDAPARATQTGIAADDQLRYFLRQAGVVVPSPRPRRLQTTRHDVEFAELLATLER